MTFSHEPPLYLDFFGRKGTPKPTPVPEPARVPVHVVVFGPNGIATDADARLVLDDGKGYQGVQVGPQVHFSLPPGTSYGWGARLLLKAPGLTNFDDRVTLAPDLNVSMVPGFVVPHRDGLVSLSGRAWLLNGQPWNPLTYSLLWGLGGFMKGGDEKRRVGENARWMADHGADAVRVLYEVDWTRQPYGGLIRGTSQALAEFLDWLWEDFGLRTKVTAQAGAPSARIDQIGREIIDAIGGRQHTLVQIEGTNEQFAARADAVRLARMLMASGLPVSVGWGTAGPGEVAAISEEAGVNVETLHLERTNPTERRDRQCWDFSRLRRAGDCGEPAGPASSVASEEDPFHLALQRIGSIAMGAEHWCLHTGSMVYGVSVQGPTGPRFANIWEVPNIDAIAAAVRNADTVIGHRGVANWQHTNNPIPLEVISGQVDKQYYSISPVGDVLGILTGTAGLLQLRENVPMASWALHHPVTGELVDPATANLPGYVVKGVKR